MEKYIYITILLLFLGCRENLVVVPEFESIESERVVLLEEMTGVSCPNCPKGTAEVESIKALYGDQVIPIGIHGIFLSWPTKQSKFDFRNDFSKLLETNLAPGTSKPAALINRILPSGQSKKAIISPDLWSGYIESQLLVPPRVNIELELMYDQNSRLLKINAGITANQSINEALNISVMILENNIIDAQEDLSSVIENFVHNHVLRTMLTPFDGMFLNAGMAKNEIENRLFEFELPEEDDLWIAENIEVVVFIHQKDGDGEVLQAAIVKIE